MKPRLQEQVAFRTQDVLTPDPALLVEQFLPLASMGAGYRAHSHAPPQASKALNPVAAKAWASHQPQREPAALLARNRQAGDQARQQHAGQVDGRQQLDGAEACGEARLRQQQNAVLAHARQDHRQGRLRGQSKGGHGRLDDGRRSSQRAQPIQQRSRGRDQKEDRQRPAKELPNDAQRLKPDGPGARPGQEDPALGQQNVEGRTSLLAAR